MSAPPSSPQSSSPARAARRAATLWARCATIFRLGVKELWSLWRDPMMLVLIVYTTTLAVYSAGKAQPETLYHVPIAIVDEDVSTLAGAQYFNPGNQIEINAAIALAAYGGGFELAWSMAPQKQSSSGSVLASVVALILDAASGSESPGHMGTVCSSFEPVSSYGLDCTRTTLPRADPRHTIDRGRLPYVVTIARSLGMLDTTAKRSAAPSALTGNWGRTAMRMPLRRALRRPVGDDVAGRSGRMATRPQLAGG